MANLKTTYKDDVLNTTKNTKRKFNMITNSDGTVSFEDVTEYSQVGDSFGAADVNAITEACNELNSNMEWKKLDGGNLYVMYNDIAVLVRANKTGITLASQTKDTTIFTMPSTIKPNIDIFIPCSVLNSSYVQTTINANIILAANYVQLSSGSMLNNNVITFAAMFPRNWFDITE